MVVGVVPPVLTDRWRVQLPPRPPWLENSFVSLRSVSHFAVPLYSATHRSVLLRSVQHSAPRLRSLASLAFRSFSRIPLYRVSLVPLEPNEDQHAHQQQHQLSMHAAAPAQQTSTAARSPAQTPTATLARQTPTAHTTHIVSVRCVPLQGHNVSAHTNQHPECCTTTMHTMFTAYQHDQHEHLHQHQPKH